MNLNRSIPLCVGTRSMTPMRARSCSIRSAVSPPTSALTKSCGRRAREHLKKMGTIADEPSATDGAAAATVAQAPEKRKNLVWIGHKPLKSPRFARIKPSKIKRFYLDLFGFARPGLGYFARPRVGLVWPCRSVKLSHAPGRASMSGGGRPRGSARFEGIDILTIQRLSAADFTPAYRSRQLSG